MLLLTAASVLVVVFRLFAVLQLRGGSGEDVCVHKDGVVQRLVVLKFLIDVMVNVILSKGLLVSRVQAVKLVYEALFFQVERGVVEV